VIAPARAHDPHSSGHDEVDAWLALTHEEARTVLLLLEQSEPAGARVVTRQLRDSGLDMSEASVSRLFARLDAAGLTVASGRKGRVLTEFGRRVATTAQDDHRRNLAIKQALDVRSLRQLTDLLCARRGVEREVARAAALRRDATQLKELEALQVKHDAVVLFTTGKPSQVGIQFHKLLAQCARSDIFVTLADMVLNDSLDWLEQVLDVVTDGHGTSGRSVGEHMAILDAVRRQDGDAADQAMADHLTRLLDEVERFASRNNGEVFERLLRTTH
jgi:GntR family L-lactate dehydrogenase operon transcriptional regulator